MERARMAAHRFSRNVRRLVAMGTGFAVAWFLDPVQGPERRAQAQAAGHRLLAQLRGRPPAAAPPAPEEGMRRVA